MLDSREKFQLQHFQQLVRPKMRPANRSYLEDKLDRMMKEKEIESKRKKWEENMLEAKRIFLLSQGRQAT